MRLHDVTDWEWTLLLPVIAQDRACRRTAPSALRLTVNAILWRMRTGRAWRFIPEEYGNWSSIRRRFQEWNEAGLWRTITTELAEMRDRQRQALPIGGSTPPRILPLISNLRPPPG